MKHIWLLLAVCMPAQAIEWKANPDAQALADEGFVYTALDVQLRQVAQQSEKNSEDLELLESLVLKTNVEALEDYDRKVLNNIPVSTVQFLMGREAWEQKQTVQAKRLLANIPRWHRYYPEARLLLADMATGKEAQEYETQCQETASKRADEVQSALLKRYYTVLSEDCRTIAPRKAYKIGEFAQALSGFGEMSKRSYKWPALLLEKAWSAYNLKDYNRTLGLLVTYKSPLLSSYFYPEAEVLTSLSYFRLCLYDDALIVIDQYYNNYKPRTEALEKVLSAQKSSNDYFFHLMAMDAEGREKVHPFVRQLAVQIAHRPRFELDLSSLKKLDAEMASLKSAIDAQEPKALARHWMKASLLQLQAMRTNLVGRINYFAKKDMFDFIRQTYSLSEEMFKIKLEIIARKKDLVYGSKSLIADRGRGSFKQVHKTKFEQFWKFQGAFWADELGDYSFGLPSNCETVRKAEEVQP